MLPILDKMAVSSDPGAHLPSFCLAPSGRGVEALAISNARVAPKDGRAFAQASLSEFYQGLCLISAPNGLGETPEEGLFLPIRRPNPECLVTLDGKSVISRLAENCDYVIIEDADLRPRDLIDHMTMFSLYSITIQNVTKALGLTGNHAYVAWPKAKAIQPRFSGERIW